MQTLMFFLHIVLIHTLYSEHYKLMLELDHRVFLLACLNYQSYNKTQFSISQIDESHDYFNYKLLLIAGASLLCEDDLDCQTLEYIESVCKLAIQLSLLITTQLLINNKIHCKCFSYNKKNMRDQTLLFDFLLDLDSTGKTQETD